MTKHKKIESLSDVIERCRAKAPAVAGVILENNVQTNVAGVKLKSFPDHVDSLPNEWIRSALFPIVNKFNYVDAQDVDGTLIKVRPTIRHNIPTFSQNVRMHYFGPQLNSFDQKVLLTAITQTKDGYLGDPTFITPYQFCKSLGIGWGKTNYKVVRESLLRLYVGVLTSETYKKDKAGNLIKLRTYRDRILERFDENHTKDLWEIRLSTKMADMYSFQTTWIEREMYRSIQGDFAKALYLQIITHEASELRPQSLSLETIKLLFGLKTPDRNLRIMIKNVATELQKRGVLKRWTFNADVFTFIRTTSVSL